MLNQKNIMVSMYLVGLFGISIGAWQHMPKIALVVGLAPLCTAVILAKFWHDNVVEEAQRNVEINGLKARFRIADQAVYMMMAILRVTRPHLRITKTNWGRSEDGRYSGVALDVAGGSMEGPWAIVVESAGQSRTWIETAEPNIGNRIKILSSDSKSNPDMWPEILADLISRKKESRLTST